MKRSSKAASGAKGSGKAASGAKRGCKAASGAKRSGKAASSAAGGSNAASGAMQPAARASPRAASGKPKAARFIKSKRLTLIKNEIDKESGLYGRMIDDRCNIRVLGLFGIRHLAHTEHKDAFTQRLDEIKDKTRF